MSGFDDLILEAQPCLMDFAASATAGASWRFEFDVIDSNGDLVDFSTDVTCDASVYSDRFGNTQAFALTATLAATSPNLVLTADSLTTVSVAGSSDSAVQGAIGCSLTRTSDGAVVAVCVPSRSPLAIIRKD